MPQASNAHTLLNIAPTLLHWYGQNGRQLPWRVRGRSRADEAPNPWQILLSEIMLQQTTVATVTPRFARFVELWPTPTDMANSPREHILAEWAGLGYYARARNLHSCATVIRDEFDGQVPDTEQALKDLPGIGDYTAAAIAAIAFKRRAVVVDGNVERVISRLFMIDTPLPKAKPEIRTQCDLVTPDNNAGDFAQAMMDLAASICKPQKPQCDNCPISDYCLAFKADKASDYPKKLPKKVKPTRRGHVWIIENGRRDIWLIRRPDQGLLGGMTAFPSGEWVEQTTYPDMKPPLDVNFSTLADPVTHVFTHFRLELQIHVARIDHQANLPDGFWHPIDDLAAIGLPTLMQKAARLADLLPTT